MMNRAYEESYFTNLTVTVTSIYKAKGLALAKLNRYEEAIDAYDAVLRLDPDDPDIFEMKGEALLALYPHIPSHTREKKQG